MRPSPSEPSTWWIGSGGERKEVERGNRDTLIAGGHGWYSVHLSRFSVYMLQMEIQAVENKKKKMPLCSWLSLWDNPHSVPVAVNVNWNNCFLGQDIWYHGNRLYKFIHAWDSLWAELAISPSGSHCIYSFIHEAKKHLAASCFWPVRVELY